MLKAGLTGSIATGKSFVCGVLAGLGCHILDADQASRKAVEKGSVGLQRIREAFGMGVIQPNGDLDRKLLGSIVFNDSGKRELLNSIVHPLVIALQNEWIEEIVGKDDRAVVIVDAALMIESGGHRRFDKLIVVWCELRVQIERLITRDSFDLDSAMARINSQMPQDEKRKYADFEIDTTAGFHSATQQAHSVFLELKRAEEESR